MSTEVVEGEERVTISEFLSINGEETQRVFSISELLDFHKQFIDAAGNGDAHVVKQVLADGRLTPNVSANSGTTALCGAAREGHAPVVTLLLADERVDPNITDSDDLTALLLAAREGQEPVVALLLVDERVDPNIGDSDDWTALMLAARGGHYWVVRLLLADGRVHPDQTGRAGTALTLAAMFGHESVILELLADKRLDPNKATVNGQTALMFAAQDGISPSAREGQAPIVVVTMMLADERVDPNMADQNGMTALMVAAQGGHDAYVYLLLGNERVDRNMVNHHGNTALVEATIEGHALVVSELLADERVDPCICNSQDGNILEGWGILKVAAHYGHASVVKLLLADERIDPNDVRNQGSSALHCAAAAKHLSVVKLLLDDARVDPNGVCGYYTPLMDACGSGCAKVVALLLADKRVDPTIVNNQGKTAFELSDSSEVEAAFRSDPRVIAQIAHVQKLRASADAAMEALLEEEDAAAVPSAKKKKKSKKSKKKKKDKAAASTAIADGTGDVVNSGSGSGGGSGGGASGLLCTKCEERKPLSSFSKTQQRKAKQQGSRGALCALCAASAGNVSGTASSGNSASAASAATTSNDEEGRGGKKRMSSFSSGGLDDECAYCMSRGMLMMQCRHCHLPRYCNPACMETHWYEGHRMICEPVAVESKEGDEAVVVEDPPEFLCCPITKELFIDPVVASDGETYERIAIETWIAERQRILVKAKREVEDTNAGSERALKALANGIASPMGHGKLNSTSLRPTRSMKRRADGWQEKNEGGGEGGCK